MAAILYEEVTDPHTCGRLKQSFGFCRDHAWQAADVGGTLLGMSIDDRGPWGYIHCARAVDGPRRTAALVAKTWRARRRCNWSTFRLSAGQALPRLSLPGGNGRRRTGRHN